MNPRRNHSEWRVVTGHIGLPATELSLISKTDVLERNMHAHHLLAD